MHIESELGKTVSHFDNLASMDAGRARGRGGGREGQRHRGGRGGRVHALTINDGVKGLRHEYEHVSVTVLYIYNTVLV